MDDGGIQQSIASEFPTFRSVELVCELLARLCEVASHKHWKVSPHLVCQLPDDWSDDEDDEDDDGIPPQGPCAEMCMQSNCLTASAEDDQDGADKDLISFWNTKSVTMDVALFDECIMPVAEHVCIGASRLVQACAGAYFDAQGCISALQLVRCALCGLGV